MLFVLLKLNLNYKFLNELQTVVALQPQTKETDDISTAKIGVLLNGGSPKYQENQLYNQNPWKIPVKEVHFSKVTSLKACSFTKSWNPSPQCFTCF